MSKQANNEQRQVLVRVIGDLESRVTIIEETIFHLVKKCATLAEMEEHKKQIEELMIQKNTINSIIEEYVRIADSYNVVFECEIPF